VIVVVDDPIDVLRLHFHRQVSVDAVVVHLQQQVAGAAAA
jgi:hypothetical protein